MRQIGAVLLSSPVGHADEILRTMLGPNIAVRSARSCLGFAGSEGGRVSTDEASFARIDADFGPTGGRSASTPFADLWRDRGTRLFDDLTGEIVALWWDEETQRLIAYRSANSGQTLFVASARDVAAAATLPHRFLRCPGISHQLDWDTAASWAATVAWAGERTMFAGVSRVAPGQALALSPGRAPEIIWRWRPRQSGHGFRTMQDAGAALRDTFDRAVSDRLSAAGSHAVQLSSGRDSSAILASAAPYLMKRGEPLLALTGAPGIGTTADAVSGRINDESDLAANTARRFPNVRHIVCRGEAGAALRAMPDLHRHGFQPIANFSNTSWMLAVHEAAARNGVTDMHWGSLGNFTISAGGLNHWPDVWNEDGAFAALARLPESAGTSPRAWATATHQLIGSRLSVHAYRRLRRLWLSEEAEGWAVPILRPPHRIQAENALAAYWLVGKPQGGKAFRATELTRIDNGENGLEGMFGIRGHDPTGDPRLVELCLAMPARFWLPHGEVARPLYAAAFGDRLPSSVVAGRTRGYQGADWPDMFPVRALREAWEERLSHPLNRELFDRDFIMDAIGRRPEGKALAEASTLHLHRTMLIDTLAVADFIAVHFPR